MRPTIPTIKRAVASLGAPGPAKAANPNGIKPLMLGTQQPQATAEGGFTPGAISPNAPKDPNAVDPNAVDPADLEKAQNDAQRSKQEQELAQHQMKLQQLQSKHQEVMSGMHADLHKGYMGSKLQGLSKQLNKMRMSSVSNQLNMPSMSMKTAATDGAPKIQPAVTRSGAPWPANHPAPAAPSPLIDVNAVQKQVAPGFWQDPHKFTSQMMDAKNPFGLGGERSINDVVNSPPALRNPNINAYEKGTVKHTLSRWGDMFHNGVSRLGHATAQSIPVAYNIGASAANLIHAPGNLWEGGKTTFNRLAAPVHELMNGGNPEWSSITGALQPFQRAATDTAKDILGGPMAVATPAMRAFSAAAPVVAGLASGTATPAAPAPPPPPPAPAPAGVQIPAQLAEWWARLKSQAPSLLAGGNAVNPQGILPTQQAAPHSMNNPNFIFGSAHGS